MQAVMAPVRMVSQWMMLPVMLVLVGITGTGIGLFAAWADIRWLESPTWPTAIGTSAAIWVLLPAIAGMVTNSWTIAAMLGAFSLLAARLAEPVGARVFNDDYVWIAWSDLLVNVPLAVLAGAALGWAGSAWRHDEGAVRALAAALIAGSLGSTAWDVLADSWSRNGLTNQVAWLTLALAALVVLLCRSIPTMLLAMIGTLLFGAALEFALGHQASDLTSFFNDLYYQISDLSSRLR